MRSAEPLSIGADRRDVPTSIRDEACREWSCSTQERRANAINPLIHASSNVTLAYIACTSISQMQQPSAEIGLQDARRYFRRDEVNAVCLDADRSRRETSNAKTHANHGPRLWKQGTEELPAIISRRTDGRGVDGGYSRPRSRGQTPRNGVGPYVGSRFSSTGQRRCGNRNFHCGQADDHLLLRKVFDKFPMLSGLASISHIAHATSAGRTESRALWRIRRNAKKVIQGHR
jgi:hypothetical protein